MKTLVRMMGLQGSGKSTFFMKHLKNDFVRVNLDTLKTRNQENLLISQCLSEGKSYAIDNTNPTKADRERYIPLAKENGYKVIGYFMESKIKVCIERNALREGIACVPIVAIASTSKKLEMPSYDEGFDELYYVKNDGENMTVTPWR